ncbi:MAG: retropepsin-like aspartic protease [Planctomycetota bacterium]
MRNRSWLVIGVAVAVGWAAGCGTTGTTETVLASRQAGEGVAGVTGGGPYAVAAAGALPARLDIPLARSGGYLLVPTFLNGESVGLMMIDTGASLSVVAQGVAGSLGLPKDGQGRTVGVGGFEDFDYYRAEHFSIGQPTSRLDGKKNTQRGVLRLERDRIAGLRMLNFGRALGVGLAGIVAFTDFGDVPFALDAANQRLTVYEPRAFRPPADATRHRLQNFRKLPMVRAEVDDGNQRVEVWLIIDYGADNALTLPRAVLERYPGVVSVNASGSGQTRGVGGTVTSTQTWVKNFRVFGLDLQHIPVNFETPPPTMRGEKLIGRIGNSLLQHFRLTFHPAHGWVYAAWNPAAEANGASEAGALP